MKSPYIFLFALFLSACGTTTVKFYEGKELPPGEQSVLSSMGLYPERKLALRVTAINGNPIEPSYEILLQPGAYTISVLVDHDANISYMPLTYSVKRTNIQVPLTAIAGHTYIPNGTIENGTPKLFFDDAGLDFNRECMPLRRYTNQSSNSAAGKKVNC